MLAALWRASRMQQEPVTVVGLWRRSASQLYGMAVATVVITMAAWVAAGAFAYTGAARGLQRVNSLADLVGTYHFSPSPVGPKVRGYTGAVIGDSRAARVGGPAIPEASADDVACARSADSLAAQVDSLIGTNVLNLACSGASIGSGLRGSQNVAGRIVPPQVGRLKQVEGLRYVVVAIGPNDLYWGDFLRYCYGVHNCQDNLTQGEFAYRLAAFDRDYGELLRDLNDLPGHPQVIVMTSYDVFKTDANCADTRGPARAVGLSPANLQLLADLNKQLNEVLVHGAAKYHFQVARPRLSTLCQPGHPQFGPDLQGLADPNPFHPTAIGVLRMAAAVMQVIKPGSGG
jgi:lysophospholipase L1-like esterase